MSLQKTIDTFNRINKDCEEFGDQVVPFSSDPATISYYYDQMYHLEFLLEDIREFVNYLKSL